MKHFYVTDNTGVVRRFGVCQDIDFEAQAGKGETVYEGEFVPPEMPSDILGDGYAANRIRAYPAISDQLDMLWHAMNRGDTPISEPFYSSIKAVKDAYPKQA